MLPSFDKLMALALQDPEKLESLRQCWIEDLICSAPKHIQRRLRGLQFQIDIEREKASNPVSSCVRISKMMHDGVANLRAAMLKTPETVTLQADTPNTRAAIIPFPLALVH